MSAVSTALVRFGEFFTRPAQPMRLLAARRIRFVSAVAAGVAASVAMLGAYYATLGWLPSATAYPATNYPNSSWAHRFDLAQFLGTLLDPPVPTVLTWWLGLTLLFGAYVSFGVIYAFLLSWALQLSDRRKGLGFGCLLFAGLALTITLANGLHPAIMRNALPDTGLLLLGWSGWAIMQLLSVHLIYGAILGALYQRGTRTQ